MITQSLESSARLDCGGLPPNLQALGIYGLMMAKGDTQDIRPKPTERLPRPPPSPRK